MNLSFSNYSGLESNLKVIGCVNNVIEGVAPDKYRGKYFDCDHFLYGFEVAAINEINELGEATLVNGNCYVSATNKTEKCLIYDKKFISTGLLLIPKSEKANCNVTGVDLNIPLEQFILDLYKRLNKPFAFAGIAKFNCLSSTHMTKAPIYNENIFQNNEQYYSEGNKEATNVSVFIIGVVTNYNDTESKEVSEQLKVALYHNPYEDTNALSSHTHGVVLNEHLSNIDELSPENVEQSVHIFNKGSSISSIEAEIFLIKSVECIY